MRTWFVVAMKTGRYSDKQFYSQRGFVHELSEATNYSTNEDAQPTCELLKAAFPTAEDWREKQKYSGRAIHIVKVKEVIEVKECDSE